MYQGSGFDLAVLEGSLPPVDVDAGDAPSGSRPAPEVDEDEVRRILRASPLVVTDSNRQIIEPAMNNAYKYDEEVDEYYKRIEELNATLSEEEQFFPVTPLPRCPKPTCFFPWYEIYRMSDTSPTSLRSKRFTEPGEFDYQTLSMLQIFSVRFAGNFLGDQMLVYGLFAIRDELDSLRNYIFNRSREQPHMITPDSPKLLLQSPVRGNSILDGVLLEYSLKVKVDGRDNTEEDFQIIDGCIEFNLDSIPHGVRLKSRIYGSHGPVDICYAFLKHGIEATVDVEFNKAGSFCKLEAVTAFASGYPDGIVVLANGPSQCPISSVIPVELGCELKLRFIISTVCPTKSTKKERRARADIARASAYFDSEAQSSEIVVDKRRRFMTSEKLKMVRYLTFTSQKCSRSTGTFEVGDLKVEATVTWSTMGPA